MDLREVEGLQHLAAKALEAAREVPHRNTEDPARVPAAAPAQQPPVPVPAGHAAAGEVARAEHQVGIGCGLDEARDVGGIVGEVRVHLEHELGPGAKRPPEPGEVRGADPLLLAPVQHLDVLALDGEPIGELTGAVRGVVVDDEEPVIGRGGRERARRRLDDRLEVLHLVVGGQHEPGPGHGRVP